MRISDWSSDVCSSDLTYLHKQDGRGVNAVIVVLDGGDDALAHEIAVHAAFTKPRYLRREDVPAAEAAEERSPLEGITRSEGKPRSEERRGGKGGVSKCKSRVAPDPYKQTNNHL